MDEVIKVDNLVFEIPDSGIILENVNFTVSRGEYIVLLGKNGAGKSTLSDLLVGIKQSTNGSIQILGDDPVKSDRQFLNRVSFLSQGINLKDSFTIKKFLNFHKFFYPKYDNDIENRLIETLELDLESKIGGLSTGQKRKVQIIAALSSLPDLLIIDALRKKKHISKRKGKVDHRTGKRGKAK